MNCAGKSQCFYGYREALENRAPRSGELTAGLVIIWAEQCCSQKRKKKGKEKKKAAQQFVYRNSNTNVFLQFSVGFIYIFIFCFLPFFCWRLNKSDANLLFVKPSLCCFWMYQTLSVTLPALSACPLYYIIWLFYFLNVFANYVLAFLASRLVSKLILT